MAEVTITLSDKDGAIDCAARFDGGYTPESHAHQHARLLLTWLDKLCQQAEPAQITEIKRPDPSVPRILMP